MTDKLGRKPSIMIADVLFTVGAIIMGLAPNIATLMAGRVVVGVRGLFLYFSLELG